VEKALSVGKLIVSIAVCQSAGLIGSLFTTPAIPTWYAELRKPDFSPPNWVFAPVWTALYTLMGVAAWLIWRKGWSAPGARTALTVFVVQLVLNSLWSVLFFGLRSPSLAFVEILALWCAILLTMILFFRMCRASGWLLLPYFAWVSFAAVLNFYIWQLNAS